MLSLVADYSDTSSSDSEESEKEIQKPTLEQKSDADAKPRLPSADLLLTTGTAKKTCAVMSNPYLEAENAKTALLEKHVKMVNKDEHTMMKNGRKICWNYRKGRCRFGSNCHYAHDSDLNLSEDVAPTQTQQTNTTQVPSTSQALPPTDAVSEQQQSEPTKKRKHAGLSNTIEPSKRVMKAYRQQQQQQQQQQTQSKR